MIFSDGFNVGDFRKATLWWADSSSICWLMLLWSLPWFFVDPGVLGFQLLLKHQKCITRTGRRFVDVLTITSYITSQRHPRGNQFCSMCVHHLLPAAPRRYPWWWGWGWLMARIRWWTCRMLLIHSWMCVSSKFKVLERKTWTDKF